MSNFQTAKLVRSVVSDRDLVPVLTHFHLYGYRIQGTNGKLTLDAPWPNYSAIPINVPAEPFVRAFEAMDEPELFIKDNRHLLVSQGKMKVRIPINLETFPRASKPEVWDPMDNSLVEVIRRVRPFVSNDASRLWACGILYREGYVYATNNIVMVRVPWTPSSLGDMDTFTLPDVGMDQLIKCNLPVEAIHVRDNAVGFEMEGDVWMESLRYTEQWPDVERMFDDPDIDWEGLPALKGSERAIVEKLLPFVPDKRHPVIRFEGDKIATLEGEMEAAVETQCGTGAFHATPLAAVLAVATHMNIDRHPKAVPFADHLTSEMQGLMMGVKV